MGNKLFISLACCTLEVASWQSQDYLWATLGAVATSITIIAIVIDSPVVRALANRCSGLDLPETGRSSTVGGDAARVVITPEQPAK